MVKVTRAIIPVAGFGTRFLPATKAVPKTMFPIVDKPVIQYIVEEAIAAGITEITIVVGVNGEIIKEHFRANQSLEKVLENKGRLHFVESIQSINKKARIHFVSQDEQKGDGHAILCAKQFIPPEEPFAVLFGDDLITADVPAIKQLITQHEKTGNPVIGVITVPPKNTHKYGIVATQGDIDSGPVVELIEKPKQGTAPSNKAIIGRYILTSETLEQLNNTKEGSQKDGEIRIADALINQLEEGALDAKTIDGTRYDIGSKEGFVTATIDCAKRQGLIGKELN
jgi:UTP--glucose-1-phosphate uridylyltransferase